MKSVLDYLNKFDARAAKKLENIDLPVKSIIVESGVKEKIKFYIEKIFANSKFFVVSDENTYQVLGEDVVNSLNVNSRNQIILSKEVKPLYESVELVVSAATDCDVIIAVGSGTINDICKYASFLAKKKYVIFGTAPSMNGYISANAAITINGHKKSLKAHLPEAIIMDVDVIAAAPMRLIQSGIGDSVCSVTCKRDWYLSHLLLNTNYDETPFMIISVLEKKIFENIGALVKRDKVAITNLVYLLLLSGIGMYISGGSYPASQAEHMIAHTIDMKYSGELKASYHGEVIGVASLTMIELQNKLLSKPLSFKMDQDFEKNILRFYGREVGGECINEYKQKLLLINESLPQGRVKDNVMKKVVDEFLKINILYNDIYKILQVMGNPLSCADIGLSEEKYSFAVKNAKYSRRRFTFLDLCNV